VALDRGLAETVRWFEDSGLLPTPAAPSDDDRGASARRPEE
jgi:hypothetical protein